MRKVLVLAAVSVVAMSTAAFASPATAVPEIDAMAGFAALAVVGATVALIRGRSKR
jgi:hypothetical protein